MNVAAGVGEAYNERARHFDADALPPLLEEHLAPGPLAMADLGCGDGPWFAVLQREGRIGQTFPVYAVDFDANRLKRVSDRFPFVRTLTCSVDSVPDIPDETLDLVISTMVMEHVVDERKYLDEIRRVLRPGGQAYLTTVYKTRWAWYFRMRNGEFVLDRSHLREYTDEGAFRSLLEESRFTIVVLRREQLWFPVLDPLLFLLAPRLGSWATPERLRALRRPRVPIPGYFSLNVIIER